MSAMCPRLKRTLYVVPAFLFGAVAVVLMADAVTGPVVTDAPIPVATSAPAPESLSPTTTTRDWNETAGSIVRKR